MRNNGNTNIVSWSISAGREWGKSTKRDQKRKREKTRDRDIERKIEIETETPGMCVSDARANSENGQWESALGTLNLRSESFYYNTGLLLYLTFPTANSTVLCHKRDERASERTLERASSRRGKRSKSARSIRASSSSSSFSSRCDLTEHRPGTVFSLPLFRQRASWTHAVRNGFFEETALRDVFFFARIRHRAICRRRRERNVARYRNIRYIDCNFIY